jgi:hypothetical protein
MGELRCSACGAFVRADGSLGLLDEADASSSDGSIGLRCPSCGYVTRGRSSRSIVGIIRGITSRLDVLIGLLLMVPIVGFIAMFVVGPLMLVRAYILEGDLARATLLGTLVGAYTTLGVRAAVKREFGPDALFAGLGVLAVVGWLASHLLH